MRNRQRPTPKRDPKSPYWQYQFYVDTRRYKGSTGETDKARAQRVIEARYGWPSNAVLIDSGTSSNFSLNTVTPFGLGSAMRRDSRNLSGVNGECGAHGTNGVNGPSPHTAARFERMREYPPHAPALDKAFRALRIGEPCAVKTGSLL
jgi:hypothetical protein